MNSIKSIFSDGGLMGASLILLPVVLACTPDPVYAQTNNCAPRAVVVERLATKYGESRQSIGMAPQGRVVEMYASEATGTWTMTVTTPDGVTCLVASGQSYEEYDEAIEPAGIDS